LGSVTNRHSAVVDHEDSSRITKASFSHLSNVLSAAGQAAKRALRIKHRLAVATSNGYRAFMSEDDGRRRCDRANPSPNKENFEIDVPPGGIINIPENAPPASGSLWWEIKIPSVPAASTPTTTVRTLARGFPSDPGWRVDPLETAAYESWLFFETAHRE
jgi:hypothetical protein